MPTSTEVDQISRSQICGIVYPLELLDSQRLEETDGCFMRHPTHPKGLDAIWLTC